MISGTLTIRRRRGVIPPTRSPLRPSVSAAVDAIMERVRAKPSRAPAAPVLPADMAATIRAGLPSESFIDTFDALLDRQSALDPDPLVQPCDRTVLRVLLAYRRRRTRPTTHEIAERLGREERHVWASVNRLSRCNLLPWGDRL